MTETPTEIARTFSASRITTAAHCAVKYRRRYLDKEKVGKTLPMIRGLSVHQAAAHNHEQKIVSHQDLPEAEIVEVADQAFRDHEAGGGIRLTADEMKIGTRASIARTRRDTQTGTRIYAQDVAPRIQPAHVEAEFRARLGDSDTEIHGFIDTITTDGRVKEIKTTTGRGRTQRQADTDLQLTMYAMGAKVITGAWPVGFDFEEVNPNTGKARTISAIRTAGDIRAAVARMNQLIEAEAAGTFGPAEPGHPLCSSRWCEFWDTCPFVNPERRPGAIGYEGSKR